MQKNIILTLFIFSLLLLDSKLCNAQNLDAKSLDSITTSIDQKSNCEYYIGNKTHDDKYHLCCIDSVNFSYNKKFNTDKFEKLNSQNLKILNEAKKHCKTGNVNECVRSFLASQDRKYSCSE